MVPRIAPGSRRDIGLLNYGVARAIGAATGGGPPNLFTTLARHRGLFRRWLRFASGLMPGGKLPRRDTELLILRVAHNTALRFVMSQRQLAVREQGSVEREIEPVSADNPERDAIRNQRRQRLWHAVQNLPMVDRQIALLHLEGLSTAEVVDVTGFSEGMVAMRLSRLRRSLAEELKGTNVEETR